MKQKYIFICSAVTFMILCSCEDRERMTGITTVEATATGPTTASLTGAVGDLSRAGHDEYGFCWAYSNNPTADSHKIMIGNDPEKNMTFSDTMTGLSGSTLYYVRAYIREDDDYIYGKVLSFTTSEPRAPLVITSDPDNITAGSALCGGIVTWDGGAVVTARGVCWDTIINPSLADSHTRDSSGTGNFVSVIKHLLPNVKYYVRAYAVNSADTSYGGEVSFTTGATWPEVSTAPVTEIYHDSAVCGGDVISSGGLPVLARGVCWRKSPGPNITNDTTHNGAGTGAFRSVLRNLSPGTVYYVRAYATNTQWTAYGSEVSFTTDATKPSVRIDTVRNIVLTSASVYSNVFADGGSAVTVKGVCWGTSPNPDLTGNHSDQGPGTGAFTTVLTGLTGNTTYYVRAYATNSAGTAYSNERSFTTPAPLNVTTGSVSSITSNSAVSGGNVTGDGGYPVTARGVCWSVVSNPTIANDHTTNGSGTGSFVSNMTGLTPFMTYYVRAYATNSQGTVYGNNVTFATLPVAGDSITDIDGNVYHTVTIGTQIWLVENLKTTKYRNGDGIPNVNNSIDWSNLTTGAYCNYENNTANGTIYGRLYNWYAVNDERNIAPTGWRVATDEDWTTLINYLGGESVAGGKLKEAGYAHWLSPNTGATNETGFTALPGGYRYYNGTYFNNINGWGYWWSSTESNDTNSLNRSMCYANVFVERYYNIKNHGFSIRCIKGEAQLPTLSTTSLSSITTTTAVSGGNITSDGGSAVTARGVCWSTSQNPTTANSKTINGSGTGSFVSNLSGLTPNTTYYVRAYATNGYGTGYGNQTSFKTYAAMDIDGNGYYSVVIGTQEWLIENLRTTRYSNGDAVIFASENDYWVNCGVSFYLGAYCHYNNNISNSNIYGYLYNWFAAHDSRNIAPSGWRVATDNDWTTLINYLGGASVAGGKLKESGFAHWTSPNTGATNSSGFTALPGGLRYSDGSYYSINNVGQWWSSTENGTLEAWMRGMEYLDQTVSRNSARKEFGFSIRCVKD